MDPSAFDTLVKAHAQGGTRRWLVRLVATLSLSGVLAVVGEAASAAERPHERLGRRTQQRNRKQRSRRRKNQNNTTKNNSNGGGNGGADGGSCTPQCAGKACGDSDGCGGHCDGVCPSGQVCLSDICFTTCPGPFSCLAGSGGCPQFAACQQTTNGASVCTTLTSNIPCTTDADCGLWAICIKNPPDSSCQGNLPFYCAVNS